MTLFAPPFEEGYHAVTSRLHAASRLFHALDMIDSPPKAGVVRATLDTDIHHALRSMLAAIRPCLVAFDIEPRRRLCAGVLRTTPVADIQHSTLSMLFAVNFPVATLDVGGRPYSARVMQVAWAVDVRHTGLSTLTAIRRHLAA